VALRWRMGEARYRRRPLLDRAPARAVPTARAASSDERKPAAGLELACMGERCKLAVHGAHTLRLTLKVPNC
jgi:hypothetical protein